MLHAFLEDSRERWHANYHAISPEAIASKDGAIIWLRQFVESYRDFSEIMSLHILLESPKAANRGFHERRSALVEIMGARLPALGIFRRDGSIDEARRWDVTLFLYQLEQAVQTISLCADQVDMDLILDRLAVALLRLVDTQSAPQRRMVEG